MDENGNDRSSDPEIEDEENLGYDDFDDNDSFFDGSHIEEYEHDEIDYDDYE